jgi:hypothetical protein
MKGIIEEAVAMDKKMVKTLKLGVVGLVLQLNRS